jgi:hypothetical protein
LPHADCRTSSGSSLRSEGIRENKDESPGPSVKATKPQRCPAKISDKSLKQVIDPCHPLFWGSNSQQSAHQQAQVKAGRRDLVPLSEIFCSLECGSAQSAFVKDVLKAAFQVHAAIFCICSFARIAVPRHRITKSSA